MQDGTITIHEYAEPLGNGRAQMQRDVVVDGKLVPELSGPVGSPAPIETVRQYERKVTIEGRAS